MTKGQEVRSKMVKGAAQLLATRGVEGTSFADVLLATGAPRGSIYHHFPGGKVELLDAALDLVSSRGLTMMETTRGQDPTAVVEKFLGLWGQLLDATELKGGCAVLAVTVTDSDSKILEHAGKIFQDWTDQLADLFIAGGVAEANASHLAITVIAATEGAVVLCRAERSREPFDVVATALVSLVTNSF